jgi:hypothetical protein
MATELNLTFLESFKILFSAMFLYVIIFLTLLKTKIFGDDKKVYSFIALISAIIVSFTGVFTYTLMYSITWFSIIITVLFIIFLIATFVGIKLEDINTLLSNKKGLIIGILGVFFLIIFIKSFFALNNAYDINNPQNDSYEVNTEFNTGIDDFSENKKENFFENLNIDKDILSSVIFLIILGLIVMFI